MLPNNPVAGAGVEPKRPPGAGAGAVNSRLVEVNANMRGMNGKSQCSNLPPNAGAGAGWPKAVGVVAGAVCRR